MTTKTLSPHRWLAPLALLLTTADSSHAALLHFTGGIGRDHFTYDTISGERVSLGKLGFTNMPVEFTPDGQLYGADPGGRVNQLYRIDPFPTPSPNPDWLTAVGEMRQAGHGLAYDPLTDTLLLSTVGPGAEIYSVRVSPFGITRFGVPTGTDWIDGLTVLHTETTIHGYGVAPAGSILSLQSSNSGPNQLYLIDRTTMVATNLGDTNGRLGIAATGGDTLYVASVTGLYGRDLTTGQETLLFDDPSLHFIGSLAYRIPEPSAAILLLAGITGLALHRRRVGSTT